VIGRSVRIREASLRIEQMATLREVLAVLGETFQQDDFHRAEIRLRPSFLDGADGVLDRRYEDDRSVWTWTRGSEGQSAWWEIKLPLVDRDGTRIGSLTLWQDGMASETSLSHIHTIARDLATVLQSKIECLWHREAPGSPGGPAGARLIESVPEGRSATSVSPRTADVAASGLATAGSRSTHPTEARVGAG
jgi:hypothetical protein